MKTENETLKIDIHSITDLITNSSTTIFTYSEGSVKAVKDMFGELAKTFNITKSFDEMFVIITLADADVYAEYIDSLDKKDYPDGITQETSFYELVNDVRSGKVEKPEWFEEAENTENSYNYYRPSNELYLIPKSEEYVNLGKAIINFLYSTDHEAMYEG